MKSLTQKIKEVNEAKQTLDLQDDTIGFIPANELKKYLEIADKFLSPEAKYVVQWAIDNNNYHDDQKKNGGNWLADFYEKGVPKDKDMKELYASVGKVVKAGRQLELPFFQTEEQFEAIIGKKVSLDEIVLDLSSEAGRNEVAKKYNPLVWKIARSFEGKSNLTLDELYSSGLMGLTLAMNRYGKKTEHNEADEERIAGYTFLSFASYNIRNMILHDIKNNSHIVRVPVSVQQKEKKDTGKNTKTHTVSGDKTVGKGDNQKTMFDFMSATGGSDAATAEVNNSDIDKIWKTIFKELEDHFKDGVGTKNVNPVEIWYAFNELNGREKMKNKELAAKYGILPSNINYYCHLVNQYLLKTPKLRELLNDVRELTFEAHRISDEDNKLYENTFSLGK